jgi:hypothetical protein
MGAEDYHTQNLGIHEDSHGNVFVKDLAVIPVSTPEVKSRAVEWLCWEVVERVLCVVALPRVVLCCVSLTRRW